MQPSLPHMPHKKGNIIDQLLVITWLIFLPMEFPMGSALRYPVVALLLLAIAVHNREVIALLMRGWFLFLLPGFCFLSVLWSDAPLISIRFASFMTLGLLVCAYTAARLDYRQFVVAVLISGSLLMAGSLLFMRTAFVGGIDGGYAVIGVFNHKNVLGIRMVVLTMAALAVILDRTYNPVWRLLGLIVIPPALFLIAGSNSATALLLLIAGTLIVGTVGGIWRPASRIRGLRPALIAGALVITSGTALYVANVYRINPYTETLERLGKDSTLTGRTDIWRIGKEVVEDNPVLGVGAGAFWRPGVSRASQITALFHLESNQFYFHSTYYEVVVHIGMVGMVLFLIVVGRAYLVLYRQWLRNSRHMDAFIVTVATFLLLRSLTESELFSVLQMNPMIMMTGVFLALKAEAVIPKTAEPNAYSSRPGEIATYGTDYRPIKTG